MRILRLAAGGDGIGKLADGRTVFIPRSAPGDLIEIADLREHKSFARARLGRLLEASPQRTEPRCPHYVHDECGGCQLQHLAAPAQLEARRQFVGDALRRIAKRDALDPEIVLAEKIYDYRTKLTLAVSADGHRIGLHPYERPNRVFDLEWCHITRPELMALWQAVRELRPLLPPRLTQVVLRLDRTGGRHLLLRVAGTEAWAGGRRLHQALEHRLFLASEQRIPLQPERGVPLRPEQRVPLESEHRIPLESLRGPAGAEAISQAGRLRTTIWWQPEGGAARAVAGSSEAFPVTTFEQVHPEMGDRVREFAITQLGEVTGRHVWDLYAGVGETTTRLAAARASVESVEAEPRAVAEAEARGPVTRRHVGRVEDVLKALRAPELVITNPPRTGMHERVTAELERVRPSRIVYISCDPATLARDLLRLPSYRLTAVQAFDLFPQTAHVETVAMLERA